VVEGRTMAEGRLATVATEEIDETKADDEEL
jgi:hypothetical protein